MSNLDNENKQTVIDCLPKIAKENSWSKELLDGIRARLLGLPEHYYIFKKLSKCLDTEHSRAASSILLEILYNMEQKGA